MLELAVTPVYIEPDETPRASACMRTRRGSFFYFADEDFSHEPRTDFH